ncbi:Ig-like domain-containing protein [Roseovarius sp. D22-M7]|uniref:Ig-like domain-containing protein n=1 Tax=Roseovarius sp. D22-M7 TaxID=3127116 RepID=UPI0030103A6F
MLSDLFGRNPDPEADRVTVTIGSGDGAEEVEATRDGDGNWSLPPDFTARDGELSFSFTAEKDTLDEEGQPVLDDDENPVSEEVDSGSTTVVIDTTAPDIGIDGNIAGDDVLNITEQGAGITITGTTTAEDGQQVTVTLAGEIYTATVNDEAWSVEIPPGDLAALPDGHAVTVEAMVADAAGNPADTPATASFVIDVTAPTLAIDPVSGDDQIGLADLEGDLEITGITDAEAGQAVTLTFDGQEFTGAVAADGHGGQVWSVTVPQSAVAAVQTGAGADGLATVEVSATVADAAENPAEQPATKSLAADFNGPSIGIAPITGDNVINADESETDVTISGTTNNVGGGQEVTVFVDGIKLTSDTDTDGTWSVTLPQADALGLGDAASVAVTADVVDSDGVVAPQAGTTLTTDFTAPMIAIDTPIAGDTLNIEERDAGFDITGTTDAEDGQAVTVTVAGETYSASATGGAWSVTVPSGDLAGLSDDDTVTVEATIEDAAGNPAEPATTTFDTDFTAPTISVSDLAGLTAGDELTAGDLVDASGDPLTGPLTVNGTSDAIGQEVTVTIGTLEATSTVLDDGFGNGIWSVDIDAEQLGNELSGQTTTTISATVEDAAGNSGTGSLDLDVDLTLPEITIDAPADAAVLGLDAFEDGLDVSGTTTGVPDGQEVTIEIRDSTDSVVATTTATVASDAWSASFDATDIAGLGDEAGFTLNAKVNDGDFPVDATADIELSTDFAPEITVGEIGEEGVLILDDIDPNNVSVSGTTRGVEAGQAVTVTLRDDAGVSIFTSSSATVQGDGTWTLTLPSESVDDLSAGEAYDAQADVSNQDGRPAPQAQEQVVAYEAAQTYLVETSASGTQVTMQIMLDPRTELPNDGGFALGETLSFDPTEITYLSGPAPIAVSGAFLVVNEDNAATGDVGFTAAGILPSGFDPSEDFLLQFAIDQQTNDAVIQLDIVSTEGGNYSSLFGTAAPDSIAANNVDTLIRGRGGDDAIDMSGAGVNTVQIEADPAANGFDTVTGFSIGGPLPDRLGFAGLNNADLRGDGSEFHLLAGGDAVGANTGLIVFTTAMNDLSEGSVQAAIQGLSGPAEGDVLYFLATDGSDAQLYEVQVQDGADTVTDLARFEGLGDLTSMTDANILGFDTSSMIT